MIGYPRSEQPSQMYRLFDAEDRVIYIGSTGNAEQRIATHRNTMWWGPTIHRVQIETFPNREAAMLAEREAVQTEFPRWNINLRNWNRPGWTADNLADFITALENFPEVMVPARIKRIEVARNLLDSHRTAA